MEWDFKKFHEVIEEKITQAVENEYAMNYLITVLQNLTPINEIDFKKFTLKDIWDLMDCLQEMIDDYGNERIDISHPYYRMSILSAIFSKFETMKKTHCPSPFIFI